jgi:predicted ATPase/DNA-binding CsgD family transcriptional regulator
VEVLVSRELVGRGRELEQAARAVDAAADGGGAAVALVGEGGIGKSRLRRAVEDRAVARGVRLLSGRAVQEPAGEPFRALAEALASGFRDTGLPRDPEILRVLPTLAHLVPTWSERPSAAVSVAAIGEALLRLLASAGRAGGVLLVIEDAHWADADTAAVLRYLATNREGIRLSLLVTLRPDPSPALTVIRRLVDQRDAHVVEVAPLDDDETDTLVRSCLGVDAVSAELLAFVRAHADGIPFLVEELLAGLVRSGGLIRRDDGWQVVGSRLVTSVPATLAESVATRVQALGPRSQQVLFAAALLGRRFDAGLVAEVIGEPEDVVLAALREAAYVQLLAGAGDARTHDDQIRFRHALTREQVIALMLPPERSRLAAKAVAALERARPGLPGGLLDLAAELAGLAGDRARAVAHLAAAGDRARRRGALATAAARLEAARAQAGDDPEAVVAVEEQLAQVWALAGEVEGATRLGERALETRRARGIHDAGEIDLQLALARAAVAAGDPAEARRRAGEAAGTSAALGEHDRRLRALALDAHAALEAGDLAAAATLAEEVLVAAPDGEAACEALEVRGRIARLHDLDAAEAAFTAELAAAEAADLGVWRARALHELGTIDLLQTLRTDRLEAARTAAVEAGVPATAAVADFHLASVFVGRGDSVAAREAAQRAVAAARRLGLAILPYALVVLARTYAYERRRADVERVMAEVHAAAPGDPAVEAAAWGHVHAMLALHEADPQAALVALDRAAALLVDRPDQHFPWWGLWALLRTLADEDPEGAQAAAERGAGRGTGFNRAFLAAAVAVGRGRQGSPAGAAQSFAEALAFLDGYEAGDWLRHVLRWLVAPAAQAAGWGRPVAWLQDAVRWFTDHGQEPLASSSRVLLRDAGAPVPRRGRGVSAVPDRLGALGITSREVDVLRLVAQGLTDRQVAERLVLSPKTVEKHVSRLLAKTGAPDRRALGQLLGPA